MNVQERPGEGTTPAARIGAVIQDYAAYRKREERRQDDKRVRSYVALKLSACAKELLRFRAVHDDHLNGTADEFDLGLRRLRSAIDVVTDVPTGYTAFFDSQNVRLESATRVTSADLELMQRVEDLVMIVGRLTRLSVHDGTFRGGCGMLCQRVTDLARAVEHRNHLFAV